MTSKTYQAASMKAPTRRAISIRTQEKLLRPFTKTRAILALRLP
jgi:hypothetical protein